MVEVFFGTPSIANSKPQPAWRAIRQWIEAMQLTNCCGMKSLAPKVGARCSVAITFKDAEHLALIDDSIHPSCVRR